MQALSFEVAQTEPLVVGGAADPADPSQLARLEGATARQLAQWFRLLADETRLQILYFLLQRRELHVRALCDLLRESQPAVSHHLGLLREAGLVACRREGKHNFYSLVPRQFRKLLDTVFGIGGMQNPPLRKLRVEDSLLLYGRDGQGSS